MSLYFFHLQRLRDNLLNTVPFTGPNDLRRVEIRAVNQVNLCKLDCFRSFSHSFEGWGENGRFQPGDKNAIMEVKIPILSPQLQALYCGSVSHFILLWAGI